MTAAEIFAKEKASAGKLEPGTYASAGVTTGAGVAGRYTEIQNGDDFETVGQYGGRTYQYGKRNGQSWDQDANGSVVVNSGFHDKITSPIAASLAHPDDPKSGVRVLGMTTDDPKLLVVEVHPPGDVDQYRYYDPATCDLQRVVTYDKIGNRRTTTYSDCRTVYGWTAAFRTDYSDGRPQNNSNTVTTSFTRTTASVPSIPESRPLFALPSQGPVTLPAHFTRGGIVIQAKVNGRDVNFVLDSGSSGMVIDPGFAHTAGARSFGRRTVNVGGDVDESYAIVSNLQVGSLQMHDVSFAEFPFDWNYDGVQSNGLLGYDFIAASVLGIDFNKQTVTIYPRDTFDPQSMGLRVIDAQLDDGVPRVAASYEGVPGSFLIDTGSFATMVYQKYADKLPSAGLAQSSDRAFYAIGGENSAEVLGLTDLVFCGIRYRSVKAMMPKGHRFELTDYDGIFGRDMLADYEIFFDYADNAIFVRPNIQK